MANSWFAGLQDRFVLVSTDTTRGIVPLLKPHKVRRNYTYFFVLDTEGNAVLRLERVGTLDTVTKIKIQNAGDKVMRDHVNVLRYALTYGGVDDAEVQGAVEQLVRDLNSDEFLVRDRASRQLVAVGEPAYRTLASLDPESVEVARRSRIILARLAPLRRHVESGGLDHQVAYLSRHAAKYPQVTQRLAAILPSHVKTEDPVQWWKKNQSAVHWNAASQRYVMVAKDLENKGNSRESAEVIRNK